MQMQRAELLRMLDAVSPGIATRELIEQSSCVVFDDGWLLTYNEELACAVKTDLPLRGAVQAKALIDLLRKMPDDVIDVDTDGPRLTVKAAKARKAGIKMEAEILLPLDKVELPDGWSKLDPEFCEAANMVSQCASTSENDAFHLLCIHLTPDWMEACDNHQLMRYPLVTPISDRVLIRRGSLTHVGQMGATEISETKTWLHFRNAAGVILSCRRYFEAYPPLGPLLDFDGEPAAIPGGLNEAVERASIFSSDSADTNRVFVNLMPGVVVIEGVGACGEYAERKKISYDGPPIRFSIAPKLLTDISKRYKDCEIAPGRLKVNGGKFVYVSCLGKPPEKN
jgi:DNA polymerase III sliding clamp (beta) subunit (PCNA family)